MDEVTKNVPLKEGQRVFLEPMGNVARWWKGDPLPGVIKEIKRKYFYVSIWNGAYLEKFDRETLQSVCKDCNSSYVIYFSVKEFDDEMNRRRMIQVVRDYFMTGYFTHPETQLSTQALQTVYELLVKEGAIQPVEFRKGDDNQ